MEGGFRRLWSRKRNPGVVDQQNLSRNVPASNRVQNLPQSTSTVVKNGRTSTTDSYHQSERSYSRDKSRPSRDLYSPTLSDELGRSQSGHRLQPMLVGISRPDTGRERPETAGSFQNAVQRAADSIGRRPSDVTVAQSQPITMPKKVVSRHVDIFSVASSLPSHLQQSSRYNEEVAERNLDTFRLALENTPYVYDPSSKYQEEVAIRNAYLPYKSRPSYDTLRKSSDYDRATSMTARSTQGVITPQPNGAHTYQSSTETDATSAYGKEERTFYHVRQVSQRSNDGSLLSAVLQQYTGDNSFREDDSKLVQAQYSPRRPIGPTNTVRDDRMHTINEGQPYETDRPVTTKLPAYRDSGHSSNNGLPDYQISASEYIHHPQVARSLFSDQLNDGRVHGDHAYGPPSTRSTASSIRRQVILPHRTILDLTNDDSELHSETSSALGYSNYSPVLEQAKSDAFHRVMPSEIHTEERRGSRGPSQMIEAATAAIVNRALESRKEDATIMATLNTEQEGVQHEQPTLLASSPESPKLERQISNPSAFSPMITVASSSPRSSAYVGSTMEPMSMTARVTAAVAASKAMTTNELASVPSTTPKSSSQIPNTEEKVAGPEKIDDEPQQTQPSTLDNRTTAAHVNTSTPRSQTDVKVASNTLPRPRPAKTTDAKSNGEVPYMRSTHTAPEQVTTVGHSTQYDASGVRTRDFAISPREDTVPIKRQVPPSKVAEQVRSKSSASRAESRSKSAKSRAASTTPASVIPQDGGFDEEAFKRKQAEARAAMDRLQRSLSEDFMTLPDRKTMKNLSGKAPELETWQSAPAIILSQESKQVTSPTVWSEVERPPPSTFRTSRGESSKANLAMNSRSLSNSNRSSRRAPAPSSLKNVESANNPIDEGMLSPGLLQALQMSANPPRSPGEISLSSFPVPSSSRPNSQPDAPAGMHSHTNSIVGAMKRRNSTKSQNSSSSAFNIPYHMVPGRTSSVRDPVPEESDAGWE